MAKLITWIGNHITGISVIGLIVYLALGPLGSCGEARLAKSLGTLEVLEKANAEAIKAIQEDSRKIIEQNKTILASNKELDTKVGKVEGKITVGLADLQAWANNRPEYPPECAPIVAYLDKEIEGWKGQFSLAMEDVKLQKELVSNSQTLYLNQIKLTDNATLIYGKELETSKQKDEVIKDLKRRLSVKKIESTAFRVAIIAIGGYVAYKLVK